MQLKNISKLLYYSGLALSLAIITHISTILYFAYINHHEPYKDLANIYPEHKFSSLNKDDKWLSGKDSFFDYYICPFTIPHQSLHILAPGLNNNYTSLSFYNYRGQLIYSLNNPMLRHKPVNILLGERKILAVNQRYYKTDDPIKQQLVKSAIMIPRDIMRGFVIMRIYKNSNSEKEKNNDYAANMKCEPLI